ncbi:MAG: hypothetical protein ACRD0I_03260 [Acidimicrobiales bacterium]
MSDRPRAAAIRSEAVQPLPVGAHEWVYFADPDEDREWRFDVTFLLSGWGCIFGEGCQGVLTARSPEMAQGCCSYGAHFTGPQDADRVERAAETLTPAQWQFRSRARARAGAGAGAGVIKTTRSGQAMTRQADGACIFLNRPDFPGGPGCALHRAALERGIEPLELKPDVCWQLPLRREDTENPDGSVTSTLTQWDRRHWGDGGEEFAWWCTEEPRAFAGSVPVYLSMKAELVALCGAAIYAEVAGYLDRRRSGAVPLPHPVVRHTGG